MTAALTVTLTRVSPTHHRLAYRRADGSGEIVELETKSCLFHDLLHFALESEAGLQCSFYGLLAAGAGYRALAEDTALVGAELIAVERIVGGLTAVMRHGASADAFLGAMQNLFDAHGETVPGWLRPELIERVRARLRHLDGEWRATPFGQTMTLRFGSERELGPEPS